MEALSTNLRLVRQAKGLAIAELAELVGVHPAHLAGIERRTGRASRNLALHLARVLGIDVEVLFELERIPSTTHGRRNDAEALARRAETRAAGRA